MGQILAGEILGSSWQGQSIHWAGPAASLHPWCSSTFAWASMPQPNPQWALAYHTDTDFLLTDAKSITASPGSL